MFDPWAFRPKVRSRKGLPGSLSTGVPIGYPDPPSLKKRGTPEKKKNKDFPLCRTLKILGKESKNAQKSKTKKKEESTKKTRKFPRVRAVFNSFLTFGALGPGNPFRGYFRTSGPKGPTNDPGTWSTISQLTILKSLVFFCSIYKGCFCKKSGIFIKFEGFSCGIPREQAILRTSKTPRKSPEKWTFLSLAFYKST